MLIRPQSGGGLDHTDPWGTRVSSAAQAHDDEDRYWSRLAAWVVPALAMALIGGLFLTRPALWTDEFATWGMTVTPWAEMWPVLRYVDAVLAPYYVVMRAWAELAGSSDLALRLPSLAAMVVAAGLTGWLGARVASPRAGLLAGLVLAVLPSSVRFAQEARPYALALLVAVLATYLLVRAWHEPTWSRFALYALAVALLGLLHLIGLLLLVAHAWSVIAWNRRVLPRWTVAVAFGIMPALPLVWLGTRQRNQVAYIPGVGPHSLPPLALVLFGATVLAVMVVILALFSLPLRYPAAVFTAWAVLPVLALALISLLMPLFLPRYLIFTVPAWALLVGVALARVRLPVTGIALASLLVLAVPVQLDLRRADGHDEATRDVARIITAESRPGDVAVYAAAEPAGGWTTRDLVIHYVPADRRPADALLEHAPRTNGVLLARECVEVARCLGDPERVWVVRLRELDDPLRGLGPEKERVLRADYRIDRVWQPTGLTLALLVRSDRSK